MQVPISTPSLTKCLLRTRRAHQLCRMRFRALADICLAPLLLLASRPTRPGRCDARLADHAVLHSSSGTTATGSHPHGIRSLPAVQPLAIPPSSVPLATLPTIESVPLVSAHPLLPAPHPLHDTLALPPRQRAPLHHAVQRVPLHDPVDPKSLSLLPSQAPHLPCLSDSARVFIGTADHRSRTSEAMPSRPSRPHFSPARGFSRGFAAGGEVWSAPRHGTFSWACSAEGGLEAERGCCTRVEGKIGRM